MKGLITSIILAVGLIAAGWWFFAYGGETTHPTDEQQKILAIQDNRLSKGSPEAPVKIIEYVDMLCPYCAKSNQPGETTPRLLHEYVDTDKAHYEVRLVAKTAPDSRRAGEGAYCAAEQNKFWEYLDAAYQHTWLDYYSKNKDVTDIPLFQQNTIYRFAQQVPGLDAARWQTCLQNNEYGQTLDHNAEQMVQLDAYGTPTMVVDGKSFTGAPSYSAFQIVIDAALKQKQ